MKFLFVNIMMGMYRGGGENFDLNLSRELSNLGHEVEIIHLRPLASEARLAMPAYVSGTPVRSPWLYLWSQRLHGMPVIGRVRGLRGLPRFFGQLIFELRTFFVLRRRPSDETVTWICGLSLLGWLVSSRLKRRCYVRFPGPPSHAFHRWAIPRIDTVVANGDAYRQIAALDPPARKLLRIEVGLDAAILGGGERVAARRRLGYDGEIIVLSVGRLIAIKNLGMLLSAIRHARAVDERVRLVLVGEGPLLDFARRQAEVEGIAAATTFAGNLSREELSVHYAASDIFALSSHYDNFPNVVVEAMANGVPVVGTAVGGVPTQIDHGEDGFLVPSNDARSMAEAILRLAEDPELRRKMSQAARIKTLERHDWRRAAAALIAHAVDGSK